MYRVSVVTEGARLVGNQATLCSQQGGSSIILRRIEEVVQPKAQQQTAFDDLRKATQHPADQPQPSSPTAVPQSPVARLETDNTMGPLAKLFRFHSGGQQ